MRNKRKATTEKNYSPLTNNPLNSPENQAQTVIKGSREIAYVIKNYKGTKNHEDIKDLVMLRLETFCDESLFLLKRVYFLASQETSQKSAND